MRLLYGVVGEGMGHATRSKVVIEHLLAKKHQVQVVVSNRAFKFLDQSFTPHFPRCENAKEDEAAIDIIEIKGLVMKYVEGEFAEGASLLHNVLRVPGMLAENVGAYYEDVVRFRPEAAVSDFDSFAYLFAKLHGIPVLSIDNQQVIQRCTIPDEAKDVDLGAYRATKAFVKGKLPGCDHYIVTGFFFPEIRDKYVGKTTLVGPILRKAILDVPRGQASKEHLLVYQTSTSSTTLLPTLQALGVPCIVYGLNRDETIGNLRLKQFSEDGFVHDLAESRGVIANGGLSLLNEAVSLHKPVFSVPVKNQYEQILNAYYIQHLGYGMFREDLDLEGLQAFVKDLPKFTANLQPFAHDGNAKLFAAVDSVMDDFEGKAFHRRVRGRV